ncbi:hypothetical protein KUTeg_014181 [Tegillarca granosa]|uniref:Uncharacterized protein n=1 Tax=Tegillarca granosa TaxID=220873 RepID=A0ABQ9EVW6_TEGGR|nr:hypothetical protein KUTeg_014181 [Tegillarca granosa]
MNHASPTASRGSLDNSPDNVLQQNCDQMCLFLAHENEKTYFFHSSIFYLPISKMKKIVRLVDIFLVAVLVRLRFKPVMFCLFSSDK